MQDQVMKVEDGDGRESALIQYDTHRTQEAFGVEPRVHTIIHDRWRLSMYRGKCMNELFDLIDDPGEMYNLSDNNAYKDIKSHLIEKLVDLEISAIDRVTLPTALA